MNGPSHPVSPQVQAAGATTVGRLFASVARLNPDRVAIDDGKVERTYRELNSRVNQCAAYLRAIGLQRGDRLGLLARNCAEYLEIELAAAKLGIITAALNWRLASREMAHCIQLAEPRLIVTQAEYEPVLDESVGSEIPRLLLGPAYESVIASRSDTEPEPDSLVHPEDGMLIIYTSGTTGLPKGALISHRAMIARSLIYASEMGAPRDANYVAWTPMFHMAGSDFSHSSLMRGGTVFSVDGYQGEALLDIVARHPVHYFPVIPGMIEPLIELLEEKPVKPVHIAYIGAMADLVPRHQLARITELLGAPYMNTFGSTETGTPPGTAASIPVGVAPEGSLAKDQTNFCEIRLVDENGQDVPDGQPGELWIRGPSLFSGYWRNDEANAAAFEGGWFHMGDAFRRDGSGRLEFVDRVKYMIKSGGENIYPAEIEQVVLADKRVLDAAVVRRPDERWGEVPVLFLARSDESLTEAVILATCREALAGYKMPKAVHFIAVDEFPRSTTGKIERHKLEARLTRES